MDFDDYESLPTSSSTIHMVAGSFAGIMEHCLMYPVDSVKTRMQSLKPHPKAIYRNIPEAFSKMVHYEGLFRPVRGIPAVLLAAGPAHALHFSCYEKLKRVFSGTENGVGNPLAQGMAGACSTVLHDAVMNPAEVVKQRMQMYASPYRTCFDCFTKVIHSEGVHALYRSYTTQLLMNIPFQAVHFMVYEFCQDLSNHQRTYNPMAHMISGAISGAVAAAVTNPLDVCKTLLNTQEQQVLHSLKKPTHITGLSKAFSTVYTIAGFKGFFRGLQARVIYQVPSAAIAWSVYEFFKYSLTMKYQTRQHNYNKDHTNEIVKRPSFAISLFI
ncbi:mitoferrin-2 [Caerostris darwini]|uniref:Mitoferrin-2 n=1 Tax=Caerostris darwini TaxID=1538125 RepID=A0AAV4U9Z6_9ARAC|nr:mitoferrin-2 [Caerostris darwini]